MRNILHASKGYSNHLGFDPSPETFSGFYSSSSSRVFAIGLAHQICLAVQTLAVEARRLEHAPRGLAFGLFCSGFRVWGLGSTVFRV